MDWKKDLMLAREVLLCEPFKHKAGPKERESASAWSQVANNLNTSRIYSHSEISQRLLHPLEQKAKKRKHEIETETGISPEDSELRLAFEFITERWEAVEQELQLSSQSKAKESEKDK